MGRGQDCLSSYEATADDQKEDALCKWKRKAQLANEFLELKGQIDDDIAAVDPNGTTDLNTLVEEIYTHWRSSSAIKIMKNDDHTSCLVRMMDVANILFTMLIDLCEEQRTLVRATRLAQQNSTDKTPTDEYYEKILVLKTECDARITRRVMDEIESDSGKILKGLKPTLQMIGRRFDPSRVPDDPLEWNCPFCGHMSLNTVEEDDGLVERNAELYRKWGILNAKWDAFERDRQEANNSGSQPPAWPTNQFNGNNPMKCRPAEPSRKHYESQRYLCGCLNSRCTSKGGDMLGSTCIINCRVFPTPEGNDRHACEQARNISLPRYVWRGTGYTRKCTCTYCQCQCNKLFFAANFQRILLASTKRASQMIHASRPAVETTQFLGRAFRAGQQAFLDAGAARLPIGHQREVMNDAMTDFIVQTGGSLLSQTTVRHLQGNFGRGVDVTLPSGDRFNTRTITSNTGAHVRNNRIPGAGNSQPYPTTTPGMRSNLEPDYCCLSPDFVSASLNPTNLSNSVGLYMERMVNSDGGPLPRGVTNDVINILDDDEDGECDGNAVT